MGNATDACPDTASIPFQAWRATWYRGLLRPLQLETRVAFISELIHNVVFVRWISPEAGDSRTIVDLTVKHASKSRRPLVYVAIVPENCEAPNELVRKEMISALRQLLGPCSCVHLVLEGSGLRKALLRTVAAGIFLVGGQKGRVSFDDSVEAALKDCKHRSADAPTIVKHARDLGLLGPQ